MASVKINVTKVVNSNSKGIAAKNTVNGVKNGIESTRCCIDTKILNRNNINGRLIAVKTKTSQIEAKIGTICTTVGAAAIKYQSTEVGVVRAAEGISGVPSANLKPGSLFNNYASYFHQVQVGDVTDKQNTTEVQVEVNKETVENVDPDTNQTTNTTGGSAWKTVGSVLDYAGKTKGVLTKVLPGEEALLACQMMRDGIVFDRVKGVNGAIDLKLHNYKNLTHAEMSDVLKKYVTNSNLTDYDIRRMVNDGIPLYKANGNVTTSGRKITDHVLTDTDKALNLSGALKSSTSITNKFKFAGKTYVDEFGKAWKGTLDINDVKNLDEIVDFSNWSSLSKVEKIDDIAGKAVKTGKALGFVGDVLTCGTEIFENNFDKTTNSWNFTFDSVASTVTDITIDFATSAGATAAGAAIGSFIVPPVGTVVGAAAGIAIDLAINWKAVDWDGDGQKDSVVDMAKKGVDKVVDVVSDGVGKAAKAVKKGWNSFTKKVGSWFS